MREEIVKAIQTYIEVNDNGEVSPPVLWDACKAVLRGKIIAKSAYLKKDETEETRYPTIRFKKVSKRT